MFIDTVQTIRLILSLRIQTEDEKKQFMGLVRPTGASRIRIEPLEDWKTPQFQWEKPYWIARLHFDPFFSLHCTIIPLNYKYYLNFVYFSKMLFQWNKPNTVWLKIMEIHSRTILIERMLIELSSVHRQGQSIQAHVLVNISIRCRVNASFKEKSCEMFSIIQRI